MAYGEIAHITVPQRLRYVTHGNGKAWLWVVLHGYGQLAPYFIRHFAFLDPTQTTVLAPEGPSKFYLDGEYQRVGASWLTREDRKVGIENVLDYLDVLFQHAQAQGPFDRMGILGFSQGVSMACRWTVYRRVAADRIILWAGTFPHEFEEAEFAVLRRLEGHLVWGTRDPFVTPERRADTKRLLKKYQLPFHTHSFEGEHRLHAPLLQALMAE